MNLYSAESWPIPFKARSLPVIHRHPPSTHTIACQQPTHGRGQTKTKEERRNANVKRAQNEPLLPTLCALRHAAQTQDTCSSRQLPCPWPTSQSGTYRKRGENTADQQESHEQELRRGQTYHCGGGSSPPHAAPQQVPHRIHRHVRRHVLTGNNHDTFLWLCRHEDWQQ